ncbi:hypothetical protein [Oceaniglobus trochenteri]|uniref:hypothetical protein n=1 Tax=Oceaniglobus trochenteri TaxID=2763260 RepID=UPI001CFF84FA|nr:hypothetical protein [Oceaniglobus trochenteri]
MKRLSIAAATALLLGTMGANAMQILPPDLSFPPADGSISTKDCTQVACQPGK